MFKTLKAIISPKSFKLDKFIRSCKKYQPLNSTLKKRIEEQVLVQPKEHYRGGKLANATFCGSSIATITDADLAHHLYQIINSDGFWEQITKLYDNHLIDEVKFLVDEKQEKIIYVCYTSYQNFSCEFLSRIFEDIQVMQEIFSNENSKLFIDYEKFFLAYLTEPTSFFTSFLISIVSEEYEFTSERLVKIANSLLHQAVLPGKAIDISCLNKFKCIYVYKEAKFFKPTFPRDLCINMLKLAHNENAFNSYSEFFSSYKVSDNIDLYISGFDLTENYVFDEEGLIKLFTKCEETDEFTSYSEKTKSNTQQIVVLKLKNSSMLANYLNVIGGILARHSIESVCVAPNCDYTAYYLYFEHTQRTSLNDTIALSDDHQVEEIIRFVFATNWHLPFKPNVNMIDCLQVVSTQTLYLLPTHLSKIDFHSKNVPSNRLFILQVIKKFVESKSIKVDNIFNYSFMKLLPYTFATKVTDYIKTGTYVENPYESWGKVLTSKHVSKIKFLSEIDNSLDNVISFIPQAEALGSVKDLISKRSSQVSQFFNASLNAFNTVSIVSDITLSYLFDNRNNDFVYITNVIVSPEMVKNNDYIIIGVTWNLPKLRTIGDVIANGVNSKQLYTMICSLATKNRAYVEYLSSVDDLKQFLVDDDFNVFVNPNILRTNGSYRIIQWGKRKIYYNKVVSAFHQIIPSSIWDFLDHFDYAELFRNSFDLTEVHSLELCHEHNHYHLSNKLCPKCEKIYAIVDSIPWNVFPYVSNNIDFYKIPNYLLAKNHYSRRFEPKVSFEEVKIGIENDLYCNFAFKPIKIALWDDTVSGVLFNEIALGGLLKLKEFKNMQRLKMVLLLYKNLLPHILQGTFITSEPRMFESIHLHKDYPGQIVILMLHYMKCSAVMKEDKASDILLTKQLFAKFLVDYIKKDESLYQTSNTRINLLLDDINKLNFSEKAVMDCLGSTCTVHNTPLLLNRRVCPVCLANGITEEMIQFEPMSYFQQLDTLETTYEGGEANLYPDSNGEILKLFKDNVDLVHKSKILGKAIEIAPKLKEFNSTHPDIQFVLINRLSFMASHKGVGLKGYWLNLINNSFKISKLKDKDFVTSKGYTQTDIVNILIKVCIGIEFLHSLGVYIGDLNGGNILIKGKSVYFIDIDGMSFGDVKNFIYTDTYIYPPSAATQNITMDDDWYSLAVQAFYYLTYSHPFRGVCDNPEIPTNIVERMTKGYSVLSSAGITPPSVSIGWSFMPNYLLTFFRQTFEGNKRESMRKVLEAFLKELNSKSESTKCFAKIPRLYPCKLAISENLYISISNSLIWKDNVIVNDCSNYTLVKSCGECFIFRTSYGSAYGTAVVNDKTGKVLSFSTPSNANKFFAVQNRLLYVSDDSLTLNVLKISETTGHETLQNVTRATNNEIIDFFVTDSLKFIFLEKEDESHYAIYCNSQKLTNIDISQFAQNSISSYILYDTLSEKYLVLLSGNNLTEGVVINPDGTYSNLTLQFEISKSNFCYANTLYFVTDGNINYYRLKSQKTSGIALQAANTNSLIYHRGDKFIICSSDETYVRMKP